MPKLKTKGSVKKRFKLTGSGRVRRAKANHSHLLTHKPPKRKRHLRDMTLVHPHQEKRIKELLG